MIIYIQRTNTECDVCTCNTFSLYLVGTCKVKKYLVIPWSPNAPSDIAVTSDSAT